MADVKDAAIAVDLGGTNLRMAVVDKSRNVIHGSRRPTPRDRDSIINTIASLVEEGLTYCVSSGIDAIGVGVATGGRVDFVNGVIVDSTALIPGWKDIHLKAILQERFGRPTFVDNDGNCFAVAEHLFGKARGVNNFISVVLGTGIGGGIYVSGKILRGSKNFAAEIGHVSVDANGPVCSCGGRGCIELYASGSGIARLASSDSHLQHLQSEGGPISSKTIGEAARGGDQAAIALLDGAGQKLGIAVAGLVNVFNPESLIVSGSLAELEYPFLQQLRKTVMEFAMRSNSIDLRIEISDFPTEGGILGAAALAFEETAK